MSADVLVLLTDGQNNAGDIQPLQASQLAKTLGVRPATMSHLEQGRSLPTLPMLLALCKHYDVSPTYLLDDERPIEPAPWRRDSTATSPNRSPKPYLTLLASDNHF